MFLVPRLILSFTMGDGTVTKIDKKELAKYENFMYYEIHVHRLEMVLKRPL